MLIKVRHIQTLGDHRLRLEFSDDTVGEHDLGFILNKVGAMPEPLKDAAYFQRVFIKGGVPTWPKGYDWDPIALRDEMKAARQLRPVGDAAE